MKRALFVSLLILALAFACGKGGKYSDAKAVIDDMVKVTESYIAAMEKAEDADTVATAMNAYAAGMKKLAPRMQEIEKKYPEFKNQDEPPAELAESMEKMGQVMKKMFEVSMKTAKYAEDPKVQAAQKAMQEAMANK